MFLDNNIDVNKLADQLGAAANKVAEASGPIIAHGYHVYVEQQVVIGWEQLVFGVLAVVVCVISMIFPFKIYKAMKIAENNHCSKDHYYQFDHSNYAWGIAGVVSLSIIALIVAFLSISSGIGHIVNPEYGAIQDIVNTVTVNH